MNGHSHRIAYEALKAKLDAAEAEGDAAALDRATAALDVFMANIITDPRGGALATAPDARPQL